MDAERTRRILIADDDQYTSEWCKSLLERNGYEVVTVPNGEIALSRAMAEPFDLLVLDMVLPGVDGLGVLARLRADTFTRTLPVVVVTGLTDRRPLTAAFEKGVDDYLFKPFVATEMLVRIKSILDKRSLEEQLVRSNIDLRHALQNLQQKEAHLIQTAKLAAIGTLAAGVAHELNQPLMVVRGTVQMLLQDLAKENPVRADISAVEVQTTRMMKIINHLTDFSRQSGKDLARIDVNSVIEDAFTFIGQQLASRSVKVDLHLDKRVPPIKANRTQIEQVFLNILLNARDALEGCPSRSLTVRTSHLNDPARVRAEMSRLSNHKNHNSRNGYVVAGFKDNGPGINQSNINRIFDPFFTTKPPGKGTGLGLSVSYNIVQEHGGWIAVHSTEDSGTTFDVYLPADAPRK